MSGYEITEQELDYKQSDNYILELAEIIRDKLSDISNEDFLIGNLENFDL